jgi:Resolvase, N terminal domain
MTIGVEFPCRDGIVICADTRITWPARHKFYECKIYPHHRALDRLARSLKHLLTIAEECRPLGVDLVSLRQNIDTTLPAIR